MDLHLLPALWQELLPLLCRWLHQRHAFRFSILLTGVLFANGRRTVTSWLRAAGVRSAFSCFYYFLASLGRRADWLALVLLHRMLPCLQPQGPILFVLDDTPTPRFGPKVQGAGLHHNPTPGPTHQSFVYGHVWVTLALVVVHPLWGAISFPLRALLYVRKRDVPMLPARLRWPFRTKLEQAAQLLDWAARMVRHLKRPVRFVVDGFYAKRPFLKAAATAGVTVISRLRKDAALWSLPRAKPKERRGPQPTYGKQRIELAKRAGQQRGWKWVHTRQYGRQRCKQIKTFLATWRPAGGLIRVVLLHESHGWLAWFSTDATLSAEEILSTAADRFSIEEAFHDLKETEGLGQQQLRKIWSNVGAVHLQLWVHTLIEWWAWHQPKEAICDRSESPWDDEERRPSHADRRRALRRRCLGEYFSRLTAEQPLHPELPPFVDLLIRRAA